MDNYRENFWLSYYEIISNSDEIAELKPQAKSSIKNFHQIIEMLYKYSNEIEVSELTKYEDYIWEWLSSDEKISKLENIDELITVASEYNWLTPRESLSQFLEEVALITDMDSKDDREDYVTLMTIHTSKWLEEKRVFVCWLEDWIFPSFRSVNDNFALEEERRLMYVAMTRAREELYISRAKERFHFWDYVRNPESRFLKEIPSELIINYDLWNLLDKWNSFFWNNSSLSWIQSWPKVISRVQKIENNISDFNVWDKVSHHKFWNWIITSLIWELAEIAFSWKWIKKMNIRIAPVKKL